MKSHAYFINCYYHLFTFNNLKIYIIYLPLDICKSYFSHFYIITDLYLGFDKKLIILSYRDSILKKKWI